jgi:hypothetical protein
LFLVDFLAALLNCLFRKERQMGEQKKLKQRTLCKEGKSVGFSLF